LWGPFFQAAFVPRDCAIDVPESGTAHNGERPALYQSAGVAPTTNSSERCDRDSGQLSDRCSGADDGWS